MDDDRPTDRRHPCATTTPELRAEIQGSTASAAALARRHGINRKTALKWRARAGTQDLRTGPPQGRSTTLDPGEEALAVAVRRQARLPLDDCLHVLAERMPHLTRSTLHRCLARHGIGRMPPPGPGPRRHPRGLAHLELVHLGAGPVGHLLCLVLSPSGRLAHARLLPRPGRAETGRLVRDLLETAPAAVGTVLSGTGALFSVAPDGASAFAREVDRVLARRPLGRRLSTPRTPAEAIAPSRGGGAG